MKSRIFALSAVVAVSLSALGSLPATADESSLSDVERADLVRNRDEERLARDLYTAFAEKYPDATVFARIAAAEQRHFDRVGAALARYEVADPSAGQGVGSYAAELSTTYSDLLAKGMTSLDAALGVGVQFEEEDIDELARAATSTDNPDLDRLYTNLKRASTQHLAAFSREQAAPGAAGESGENRPELNRPGQPGQGQGNQPGRDIEQREPRSQQRSGQQGRRGPNPQQSRSAQGDCNGCCEGGAEQGQGPRRGR